jgi:hypothetical protein
MKNAMTYLKTLSLMLEARKHGDEDREDRLLDELDTVWLKLSKREEALINSISKYIARDLLSLSNLKKLIRRLEQEMTGSIVCVRVYQIQKNMGAVQKNSRPSVFHLPGPAETMRRSPAKLTRNFVRTP